MIGSGFALGFGTAMECAATDCGTVAAHRKLKIEFKLEELDPD